MKVNGIEITEKDFAYDGCHKIYLLKTYGEKQEAKDLGYEIYPIRELPRKFWASCPLKFIGYWDLSKDVVPQCTEFVEFEGFKNNGVGYEDCTEDNYEEEEI